MEVIHKIDERGRASGCPVGHRCDDCNWYRPLYMNKRDGSVVQEFDCNLNNFVTLQDETKARVLGVQQSVDVSRKETMERQDAMLGIFEGARNASLPRQ